MILFLFSVIQNCLSYDPTIGPIIGILTQPSEDKSSQYPNSTYSSISYASVQFIQSMGARVVYIPYEAPQSLIKQLFQSVNGIYLTGGETDFYNQSSQFTESVAYILQLWEDANQNQDFFPLLGICQGLEMVYYIWDNYNRSILIDIENEVNIILPIQVLQNEVPNSQVYSQFPADVLQDFTKNNLSLLLRKLGIEAKAHSMKQKKYVQQLKLTAITKSSLGRYIIASSEGIKYPIYLFQFHPEQAIYEWKTNANHSSNSIIAAQTIGNVFVQKARLNTHKFDNELNRFLIEKQNPVFTYWSDYMKVYFMKLFDY